MFKPTVEVVENGGQSSVRSSPRSGVHSTSGTASRQARIDGAPLLKAVSVIQLLYHIKDQNQQIVVNSMLLVDQNLLPQQKVAPARRVQRN